MDTYFIFSSCRIVPSLRPEIFTNKNYKYTYHYQHILLFHNFIPLFNTIIVIYDSLEKKITFQVRLIFHPELSE